VLALTTKPLINKHCRSSLQKPRSRTWYGIERLCSFGAHARTGVLTRENIYNYASQRLLSGWKLPSWQGLTRGGTRGTSYPGPVAIGAREDWKCAH